MQQSPHSRKAEPARAIVIMMIAALAIVAAAVYLRGGREENTDAVASSAVEHATPPRSAKSGTKAAPKAKPDPTAVIASNAMQTWRGQIISNANQKPIPGAKVTLYAIKKEANAVVFDPPLESQTAGEDGRFTLTKIPGPLDATNTAILHAEAPGYATTSLVIPWLSQSEAIASAEYKVGLDPARTVAGRVADESGGGVSGALVKVRKPSVPAIGSFRAEELGPSTHSDAEGKFALSDIPLSTTITLIASAPGFISGVTEPLPPGAPDPLITLTRGEAKVHGAVSTAEGAPIPYALVSFGLVDRKESDAHHWAGGNSTRADAQGRFALTGLAPGRYGAAAFSPDRREDMIEAKDIELAAGEDREVNIVAPASIYLLGRALDADTGKPIAGMKFGVQETNPRYDNENRTAVSAADGAFTLRGITIFDRNNVQIYYDASTGYTSDEAYNTGIINFTAAAASPIKRDFKFRRSLKLLGNVYLADGTTPAPRAKIECAGKLKPQNRETTANDKGEFAIDVTAGETVSVTASTETATGQVTAGIPANGFPTPVKIVIQDYAKVSGHVLDSQKNPIAGIQVAPLIPYFSDFIRPVSDVKSDAKGFYELKKLPSGVVKITLINIWNGGVGAPPEDPLKKYVVPPPTELKLAPGENKTDVDFILTEGDTFEGLVLDDETGKPVPDAIIYPTVKVPGYWAGAKSDAEGKFHLDSLPADAVITALTIVQSDYNAVTKQNLTLADSPLTVRLHRGGMVKLIVTHQGAPVTRFEYRVLIDRGSMREPRNPISARVTDAADGATQISGITDGRWIVQVQELSESGAITGRHGSASFDVDSHDAAKEVAVSIDDGRTVSGRILREDNAPVAGAEVSIGRARNDTDLVIAPNARFDAPVVLSDPAGAFRIVGAYPGKQEIIARIDGLQMKQSAQVTVSADSDPPPIDITMVGPCAVFGKAIGKDGQPIAGAEVDHDTYTDEGLKQDNTRTDAQGAYRFDGLKAGGHHVTLVDPTHGIKSRREEYVKAGEQKEIDFDFSTLVELSGAIIVDGKPTGIALFSAVLMRADGSQSMRIPSQIDGTYKTYVDADEYDVYGELGGVSQFYVGPLTLPAQPLAQTHDFVINLATVSVALVFPTDGDFVAGQVTLSPEPHGPIARFNYPRVVDATKVSVVVPNLGPGKYRATFHSNDDKWDGASDLVGIAGPDNVITVDVKALAEKVDIGTWTPRGVDREPVSADFDVTPHVRNAGEYRLLLEQASGTGCTINSVAITVGGAQAAIDAHIGWVSKTSRDAVYRFTIPASQPGAACTIRVTGLPADGSSAHVYLLTP